MAYYNIRKPKLPVDGLIYTLTAGRVLNTIVFQINLGELLLRATFKVRLGSCLSTALKMDELGLYQSQCTSRKIHSLSTEGTHSRVLASTASPTSPPYVGKQLTAPFHIQQLLKHLVYGIAASTVNCVL